MATVLMLTEDSPMNVLPALGLLAHEVRQSSPHLTAVLSEAPSDVVVLDARSDLAERRTFAQLLRSTGLESGLILVLSEGGLAVVTADWGADDVVVATASPAEVEARIRLVMQRSSQQTVESPEIRAGAVTINEATYTARVGKRALDLTYKEFELLKYLAQHPGRVFSREQLLHEVWGYDYFGGTRTVDVHVRRLRAKLGSEYEGLIGTVRNVGYRFVVPQDEQASSVAQAHAELS